MQSHYTGMCSPHISKSCMHQTEAFSFTPTIATHKVSTRVMGTGNTQCWNKSRSL